MYLHVCLIPRNVLYFHTGMVLISFIPLISAESMSEITSNFRLGFGSFVDKKTMPYVSMIPEK